MNSKEIQVSYRVGRWNRYRCNHDVNIRAEIGDSSSRVLVPCVPATRTFTRLPFVLVVVPPQALRLLLSDEISRYFADPRAAAAAPGEIASQFRGHKGEFRGTSIVRAIHSPGDVASASKRRLNRYRAMGQLPFCTRNIDALLVNHSSFSFGTTLRVLFIPGLQRISWFWMGCYSGD